MLEGRALPIAAVDLGRLMFESAIVEVTADGSLLCVIGECPEEIIDADNTVVYRYKYREHEQLVAAGNVLPIANPPGFPSAFGPNAFHDLADALHHYSIVRGRSDCESLRVAWRDGRRLAFVSGPEHFMRRSLELFLRDSLRHHRVTVMPEQMVNETEPVDIKVSWTEYARHALIEIKWLGKSAPPGATHWSSTYSASRAVTGANQLKNYLDKHHTRVFDPTTGYIVVFDARRSGLNPEDTDLPHDKAFRYQYQEITYPDAILNRIDFGSPVRVFLEPRC